MEPVTHFLTGAVLSRAGFNRRTPLATVTMTLAAEAPDIDVLAYFKGSAYEFIQHRGVTHTFYAVPFMAALAVGLVWMADTLWQRLRKARGSTSPTITDCGRSIHSCGIGTPGTSSSSSIR